MKMVRQTSRSPRSFPGPFLTANGSFQGWCHAGGGAPGIWLRQNFFKPLIFFIFRQFVYGPHFNLHIVYLPPNI